MKTVLALALTLCAPSTAIAADAPVEPRLPPRALALEALAAMADAAADGPGGEAVFSGAYDGSRSEPRVVRAAFGGFTPPPPPPPVLTPPSLNPGLGGVSPAPRVEEPVAATPTPREPQTARPSPAEPGSSGGGGGAGVTPCQDLRAKAARLETAAELCRRDISAGAPYCHVTIPYDSPSIPKTLSPGEAEGYAGRFRQVASQGDEQACRDYGGVGVIDPAGAASLRRAVSYYSRLCSTGDNYACDARQITQLCFNNSQTNTCVRDCLIDKDPPCAELTEENARYMCRKDNHWFCYGYDVSSPCRKFVPNVITELRCVRGFPRSDRFLHPNLK